VGYTRNERLDRRTALVYGDDIGLSASRARRAMEAVNETMQLPESEREFEGRGYVHADDVVNSGFVQGDTSYVKVQVVYDELAVLDDLDGVDITRVSRELQPRNPLGLNLMRITVDGKPIDDPQRSSSDIQRCTDVALERTDLQFRFDNLDSNPRLSVVADPSSLTVQPSPDGIAAASPVRFRAYSNYSHFIERSEVRVFERGESLRGKPLAVLPVDENDGALWRPELRSFQGPVL
jgi:hypothetical protein